MVFNSVTFVVFFVVVLLLYQLIPSWSAKKTMLLCASYVFYGAWSPPFSLLLLLTTLVDYWTARRMWSAHTENARRLYMAVSLAANLGLLGYFKYGAFMLDGFVALVRVAGFDFRPATPNIVLPVGISFYTFQTLSYTIDVYRKQLKPAATLLDFALFVSFFPQLVAGPIVRAADFLYQLENERFIEARTFGWGLFLMTLGLFEKMVLADSLLGPSADAVFGSSAPLSPLDSWLGVVAFAGQIFCDFAGYSTCAIGAALCLGFHLVDNFRCPYGAVGFRDFWRRWHISLSTWLRDYVYIPLGGNRHGRLRTYLALMGTMVLGGLWHGAAWKFIAWGSLHGVLLVAEQQLLRAFGGALWLRSRPARVVAGVMTYGLVCIGWVFFRAKSLTASGLMLASMLGAGLAVPPLLPSIGVAKVVVVSACLIATHVVLRDKRIEDVVRALPGRLLIPLWSAMLFTIVLTQGGGDAFIYFQF